MSGAAARTGILRKESFINYISKEEQGICYKQNKYEDGQRDSKKKARRKIYGNQQKLGRPWDYNGLYCYRRLEEYRVLILCHQVKNNVEQENDGK